MCEEAAASNDVLTLSKLCQTLDDNPLVVDLVLLMRPPSSLLVPLESFVNNLQQNEDDDIGNRSSHVSNAVYRHDMFTKQDGDETNFTGTMASLLTHRYL